MQDWLAFLILLEPEIILLISCLLNPLSCTTPACALDMFTILLADRHCKKQALYDSCSCCYILVPVAICGSFGQSINAVLELTKAKAAVGVTCLKQGAPQPKWLPTSCLMPLPLNPKPYKP